MLAFRNLMRYGRRTLITASAIAFGLSFYIWVDSILVGLEEESERNLIRYETGSGAAALPGYLDRRERGGLEDAIPWNTAVDDLKAAGLAASPRIPFDGSLIFFKDPFPEDGSIPLRLTAVDPLLDRAVFDLGDTVAEGDWLRAGYDGIVLGSILARDIGAVVGAPVIVKTETRDGYAQTLDLEVVGLLDSPNPDINRFGAYIPLDVADAALEMNGEVPVIHIGKPTMIPEEISNQVVSVVSDHGLEWYTWQDLEPHYVAMMQNEYSGSAIFVMLILIIAAVGISNTMLMAVLERRREVGMMRALGMADRGIRRLFLWESAGIGAVGSFIGVVVGALVNIPVVRHGLDYTFFFQESSFGFRSTGVFYGAWHLQGFLIAIALGVGLSVAVASLSIRRILRIGIVESLRYD